MLSDKPALPPPPLDSRPNALQSHAPSRDDEPTLSQRPLESHSTTSASPFHGRNALNPAYPSLSPSTEYHSGYAADGYPAPCRSSSPSHSLFNLAIHRRQNSFPNLLPAALRSRTPSPTRKTHERSGSEQMPYTGDNRRNASPGTASPRLGALTDWWNGSPKAGPGITPTPARTRQAPTDTNTATDPATPKSTGATNMTAASRFISALSSRFTQSQPANNPSATNPDDVEFSDLCNLNIEAALFPHAASTSPSSPSQSDTFSPAAYKNLQMNALGLLNKFQSAMQVQAAALRAVRAEREAQRDELDAAVTRARHLKMQLEDMAQRAQEQEKEMQALAEELEAERRRRRRKAEDRILPSPSAASCASGDGKGVLERESMISEDLGVDEDRKRRRRRKTEGLNRSSWKSSSSGSHTPMDECVDDDETDEDQRSAESESVFSRCRSPALTNNTSTAYAPSIDGASLAPADEPGTPHVGGTKHPRSVNPAAGSGSVTSTPKQQPISAFQKIFKGFAAGSGAETANPTSCRNCKGQDPSVAWDTVSLLRDENRELKRRVGELEEAVEGALDAVRGIGL